MLLDDKVYVVSYGEGASNVAFIFKENSPCGSIVALDPQVSIWNLMGPLAPMVSNF